MRKTVILAVVAMMPTLAHAQSVAPTAADRTAMATILNQVINLQQQQLQALQQIAQPHPKSDDRRACILADQDYTEGAPAKAADGKVYICTRISQSPGDGHDRLVWSPTS